MTVIHCITALQPDHHSYKGRMMIMTIMITMMTMISVTYQKIFQIAISKDSRRSTARSTTLRILTFDVFGNNVQSSNALQSNNEYNHIQPLVVPLPL